MINPQPTPKSTQTLPRWRMTLDVIWWTLRRFEGEQRRRDAAALTYTTLFALVPMITVTYAILSAIPSLQSWGADVHSELLSYLMPEGSGAVSEYLVQFSQQARKLTWVGVLFLFITAFMLLRTIEMQFNRIWHVDKPRSGLQTFLRYWAVLSLGPLLFGAALAASSLVASLPLWSNFSSVPMPVKVVPWLLSSSAITAIYLLVPNCRVPWKDALIAGLIVSTVFEIGKFLFARMVGLFPSYQLIYGAFAAVPLFLLWVYLAWTILLFGAELTFSLSHYSPRRITVPLLWQRLRVIQTVCSRQLQGVANDEASLAVAMPDLSADMVSEQLEACRRAGVLTMSADGNWYWLLDSHSTPMRRIVSDLPLEAFAEQLPPAVLLAEDLRSHWLQWQQRWSEALDTPVAELLTISQSGD